MTVQLHIDTPRLEVRPIGTEEWQEVRLARALELRIEPRGNQALHIEVIDGGEDGDIDPSTGHYELQIVFRSGTVLGPFYFTGQEKKPAENENELDRVWWSLTGPCWDRSAANRA